MHICRMVAAIAALGLFAVPASAQLTFNFDDGTNQGWTVVSSSANITFGVTDQPAVGLPAAQSGTYQVAPIPFGERDNAHSLLVFRSPEFFFNGTGDLSGYLTGGQGNGMSQGTPVTNSNLYPASSSDDANSFQGFILREAVSGNIVGSAQKSAQGDAWEQIIIPAAVLAPLVNDGVAYTVDLVDYKHGGWGWVAADTIVIPGALVPEPASATLILGALFGLAARRRRA